MNTVADGLDLTAAVAEDSSKVSFSIAVGSAVVQNHEISIPAAAISTGSTLVKAAAELGANSLRQGANAITNPEGTSEQGGLQQLNETVTPAAAGMATTTVMEAMKVPAPVAESTGLAVEATLTIHSEFSEKCSTGQSGACE